MTLPKSHKIINIVEHKKQGDGLNRYCKKCEKERRKNQDQEKLKESRNKYYKNRRDNDMGYRLLCIFRTRVRDVITKGYKSAKTKELLGCDGDFLIKHLEKHFREGMSWENFGEWQVDHIKPCNSFNFMIPEHQRKCFNYKNLQPLWANENRFKSDRTDLKPEDYKKGRDYDFFQKIST